MTAPYQPGSPFGDYVLQQRLGGGGFGEVWLAQNAAGDRVALKLLTGNFAATDSARLRTDIELLAAAAVRNCPNVVQVLAGGTRPAPHVVMEYIDGTDLQHQVAMRGALPPEETLTIARGISLALAALERAKIVHRDIKPDNVMLDREGVVKLADFGIAHIAGMDTTGSRSGTPLTFAYAAPEAFRGETTSHSDLYAFGAVLFYCLAGRPPFVGDPMSMMQQHAGTAPDLSLLPPSSPAALRDLVARCLSKQPEQRPRNSAELLVALEAAEYELRAGARPTIRLPVAFGPWLRRSVHPARSWAFICEHETTGQLATVEVHFSDSFEYGSFLRRAVDANPRLVVLGAERLLGTSRLILRPGESWPEPPAVDFQFWVAREELPPPTVPTKVSVGTLRQAALGLRELMTLAASEDLGLSLLREQLHLLPDGRLFLERPGLPPFHTAALSDQAFVWLHSLPLEPLARSLLDGCSSLSDLIGATDRDSTMINSDQRVENEPPDKVYRPSTPRPTNEPRSGSSDFYSELLGNRPGDRKPHRGHDVHLDLTLSVEEARQGAIRVSDIRRTELCPSCGGLRSKAGTQPVLCTNCRGTGGLTRIQRSVFGQFNKASICHHCKGDGIRILVPCEVCDGVGRVRVTRRFEVRIPPGVDNKSKVRLNHEGDLGSYGGSRGDIYFHLTVK